MMYGRPNERNNNENNNDCLPVLRWCLAGKSTVCTTGAAMNWPRRLQATALFAKEWLKRPAMTGAICPSSRRLANTMARQVPNAGGCVVELGGGTGVVTAALLEQGVVPERLIVVERSAVFAGHLQQRFPDIRVICGDARQLGQLLPRGVRVDAIVSCLPLRSLPEQDASAITAQWQPALAEDGVIIQFTYDIRPLSGLALYNAEFIPCASEIVWANLPPARVVTARKIADNQFAGDYLAEKMGKAIVMPKVYARQIIK